MALITCPECGKSVSEYAETCPHCGYRLKETATSITYVTYTDREGYDIMLVDYTKTKMTTANALKSILDITYSEAKKIVDAMPVYLFNDLVNYDDAVYICRACQNEGMKVALYDPNNNVTYYNPNNFNMVSTPIIYNVMRKPMITVMPKKQPSLLNSFGMGLYSPAPQMKPRKTTVRVVQQPKRQTMPKMTTTVKKTSAPKTTSVKRTPAAKPKAANNGPGGRR